MKHALTYAQFMPIKHEDNHITFYAPRYKGLKIGDTCTVEHGNQLFTLKVKGIAHEHDYSNLVYAEIISTGDLSCQHGCDECTEPYDCAECDYCLDFDDDDDDDDDDD